MWWWLLSIGYAADWSAELGGQFDQDSHGIANVAWKNGPWQVAWITDTLDVRYAPEGDHGRSWLAARVETFAGQMWISPWTDGAPDPAASAFAAYAGVEGGGMRYGPAGTYVGALGFARQFLFFPKPGSETVPADTLWLQGQGVVGWWRKPVQAWLVGGMDLTHQPDWLPSPHLRGQVNLLPLWTVAPWVQVNAGLASQATPLVRIRVGGLNPYVVPVAGAAWAEWWADDYAVVRAGPSVHAGAHRISAAVDGAVLRHGTETLEVAGLLLQERYETGSFWLDLAGGYGFLVPRAEGLALSAYVLVGARWPKPASTARR